jgi:hypothetical protein
MNQYYFLILKYITGRHYTCLALILFCILPLNLYSQIDSIGIGVNCGIGSISGNLPSQTSFVVEVTLDFTPEFLYGIPLRLGVLYARKFEVLLPSGLQEKYYPYVKGVFIKGVLQQPLGQVGYLEESLGPLLLNDRTFNDVDSYDIGAVFSLMVGLDLRGDNTQGFKTGFGVEYCSTFTNTTAQYSSVYLQGQFFF